VVINVWSIKMLIITIAPAATRILKKRLTSAVFFVYASQSSLAYM